MQAAFLAVKLPHLTRMNEERRRIAKTLVPAPHYVVECLMVKGMKIGI